MNPIIFGSKQFFLGTIRLTSGLLSKFKITPARFNMLTAITNERGGVAQRRLRDILGVSGPTISRMLKSLEKLGLVVRKPHPRNRRHRWVNATVDALVRLQSAVEDFVEDGFLSFATVEMLNPEPGNGETGAQALATTRATLERARNALGDIATLSFAYDP